MSELVDDLSESIETIAVKTSVIKTTNIARGEEIGKMLAQAIRLTDKNVFFEPSCPLCTDAHRKEFEQTYNECSGKGGGTPFREVKKFAKDTYGVELETGLIENHFLMHVNSGIREQQKVEHARVVKQIYNQPLSTLDGIAYALATLTAKVIDINSLVPTHADSAAEIAKIQSVETSRLMATMATFWKLRAQVLGEMKSDKKLIWAPTDEFLAIFNEAILDAKTEGEKKVISNLLDKLTTLVSKTQ